MVVIEDASTRMDTVCAPLKVRSREPACVPSESGSRDRARDRVPRLAPRTIASVASDASRACQRVPSIGFPATDARIRPSSPRSRFATVPPRRVGHGGGVHVHVPADGGRRGPRELVRGFRPARRSRLRVGVVLVFRRRAPARAEGLLDPGHARPRRVPALRAVQEHPGRRGRRRERAPARPRRARLVREADHPRRRRVARRERRRRLRRRRLRNRPGRRFGAGVRRHDHRRGDARGIRAHVAAHGARAEARVRAPAAASARGRRRGDRGAHPGRTRVEALGVPRALQARVRGMGAGHGQAQGRVQHGRGRAGCAAAARGELRHRAGVRARGRARGGGFFYKKKQKTKPKPKRETRQKSRALWRRCWTCARARAAR